MFVPFISSSSSIQSSGLKKLFRRKGGGGGGRGSTSSGSSRGGRGSSSSASSSSSSSGSGKSKSSSSSSWWSSGSSSSSSSSTKKKKTSSSSSSSWSSGTTKSKTVKKKKSSIKWSSSSSTTRWTKTVGVAAVIPAGYPFAGRIAGGGVRDNVYGTRTYGSGYPGIVGRGTSGRGFPFFFWPLAWPLAVGSGAGAGLYLHSNYEYGAPQNTTRPGGPMAYATFPSISNDTSPTSTFRFLADNTTVALTIVDVSLACNALLNTSAISTTPILFTELDTTPSPEQAIQYYRASTAVLTLDGYNNTATYQVEGTPDSPIPENTNRELMACLNETIGANIPLIDGALGGGHNRMSFQLFGSVGLVLCLLSWL